MRFLALCIACLISIIECAEVTKSATRIDYRNPARDPCQDHPQYPDVFVCTRTRRCLSRSQYNNRKCDCCGPIFSCTTCLDRSDEPQFQAGHHRDRTGPSLVATTPPSIKPPSDRSNESTTNSSIDSGFGSESTPTPIPAPQVTPDSITSTSPSRVSSTTAAAPPIDQCELQLDVGKCPSTTNTSITDLTPTITWYFDTDRAMCIAFTYYGCTNEKHPSNRFRSRVDCSLTCEPIDRSTCAMNKPSKPGRWLSKSSADRSCANLQCPRGHRCIQGSMRSRPKCCTNKTERLYDDAHQGRGLCPANTSALRQDDEIVVGASCKTLQCPEGYECKQNRYFSNCCRNMTADTGVSTSTMTNISIDDDQSSITRHIRPRRDLMEDDDSLTIPAWTTSGKFQGDMAGFDNQSDFDQYIDRLNRQKANERDGVAYSATIDVWRLWDGGIVPYKINTGSASVQEAMLAAFQQFHTHTCVRFVERTNQAAYLNIISSDDGCFSYLGRRNASKPQNLNMGIGCTKLDAIHELMHALGFWHEHQRTDRDQHIIVNREHIETRCYTNNYKTAQLDQMNLIGSYDIRSIMHYPSITLCSTNGEPTIKPRNASLTMGNKEGLTSEDVSKIRSLYCSSKTSTTTAARPTTTTSNTIYTSMVSGTTSSCQSYPTSTTWLDPHRDKVARCGEMFVETNCNGHGNGIAVNWGYDMLSETLMATRPARNWDDTIASLLVNPHCSITLCSDKNFGGECRKFGGENTRTNVDSISSMERRASSLYCQCTADAASESKCPLQVRRNGTLGGSEKRICAFLYDRTNCNGHTNWISSSEYPDLMRLQMTQKYNYNWDNEIGSLEINPGCKIKLCTDSDFRGQCHTFYGFIAKNIHDVGWWMKYKASSLNCSCD